MNYVKKRRIGTRRTYRIIHGLNHRLTRSATRMLNGARRPRKPKDLAVVCHFLDVALRIRQRMAKREPNLFGPHAHEYYVETLALVAQQRERQIILDRVYGSTDAGSSIASIWAQRYPELFPQA